MKTPIRLGRCLLQAAAIFLFTPAHADQPIDGCYHNDILMPWIDVVNCTHPALGDPDIGPVHFIGEAHPKPPHECPYDDNAHEHPAVGGSQETNDIGEHAWHELGN